MDLAVENTGVPRLGHTNRTLGTEGERSNRWRASGFFRGREVEMDAPMRSRFALFAALILLGLTFVSSSAAASFAEYTVPTANGIPYGIVAGPDGAIWFTEYNTNNIGRLALGVFAEYGIPTANSGPTSITVGPDNALWFTEALADKIGRITTSGTITEYPLTANSAPYAIVSDGVALWFTESASNKIGKITTSGTLSESFVLTANSQPQGIVRGSDGALWFVEHAANKIGRVTTGGVFTAEYIIPTSNSGAIGIAAGPDGALWFTESAASQIGRITTAGVITNEFSIPTPIGNPLAIISGPGGALWFTENNADKIAQITTGGAVTEYAIPTANSAPIGLATPGGNVWFAESNANKIGVLVLTAPTPSKIFVPYIAKTFTLACVGAGTYDDTDSRIAYSGNWQLYSGTGPYNNTLHYSDGIGESAQLVFCGVGVTILYASGPNGGVTNVSIDSVSVGTINHYSSAIQWQQQWISGALANGTHILTLTHASGTRVNLDAISVTAAPPAPSSICVSVYYDVNGNQIFDSGEPLLRGAQITLKNSGDVQVGSFVSYDTGPRCFTNLPADTYTVIEGPNPPAFASTTPDTQSVNLPSGGSTNVHFGDSVSQPHGMVSDTSRGHLFITSRDTGWLLAWDEINNRTLTTIHVGTHPHGVGLVNDRVFVAVNGSQVVTVVDAATQVVLKEINLASSCPGGPMTVAVHPNAKKAYVAMYGYPGHVAVIDAVTLGVQCLTTGDGTTGVAVNPSLNQLYVTSRDAQSLQVFDTNTNILLQTVLLGGQAYFVQAKPSTNQVYVTVAFDPPDYATATTLQAYYATLTGVTLPLTTTATISNTEPGGTIWVSRANGNLYVAASHDNRVQIINPVTLAILQTIVMTESNSLPFGITENDQITPGTVYVGKRNVNLILKLSNNLH